MKLRTKLWIDYYVGGTMHVLLKPFVIALGRILRRNHDLSRCSAITVVKLLGGGSLVIAYPMLLALRSKPSVRTLRLIATPATAHFAETLGVFDEIVIVRDDGIRHLLWDTLRVIRRFWRTDAVIDLEIHSRLTTVLCLLTSARNRVGFFTEVSFWRRELATHLLFCHVGNPIFQFYDQIAKLFDAPLPSTRHASDTFRANLAPAPRKQSGDAPRIVAVAPCCSDLRSERMIEVREWVEVLSAHRDQHRMDELVLLGGPDDVAYCTELERAITGRLPGLRIVNAAGTRPLRESVRLLGTMDHLLAIDSGLLHFARLLGVPTTSFWGPTAPRILLRPSDLAVDQVHYAQLPCSPCVHVVATPPCRGNNLCMRFAVNPDCGADPNPPWLAEGDPAGATASLDPRR